MGGDWKRVSFHGSRRVIGVFPVEPLAYQVSMVWYNTGLSVGCHQSYHFHILHIFQTLISLKLLTQVFIFANGKLCFYTSMELYLIQLKNEEVKN